MTARGWAALGLACLVALYMSKKTLPKGLRNNNPGNIRGSDAFTWQGEAGRDGDGFVVFATPFYGLRALGRTLLTYRRQHSIDTLESIISRWAPSEDGNDTAAYIAHAARALDMGPDATLQLEQYPELMAVIIKHENGQQPYTSEQILEGWNAAQV